MASDDQHNRKTRTPFTRRRPQKRTPTTPSEKRREFVQRLTDLQKPNRVALKNASKGMVPMLPQTAALHLAVYDGLLPKSDVLHLHIIFQDLSRNPRKGTVQQWDIPEV